MQICFSENWSFRSRNVAAQKWSFLRLHQNICVVHFVMKSIHCCATHSEWYGNVNLFVLFVTIKMLLEMRKWNDTLTTQWIISIVYLTSQMVKMPIKIKHRVFPFEPAQAKPTINIVCFYNFRFLFVVFFGSFQLLRNCFNKHKFHPKTSLPHFAAGRWLKRK